MIPTVIGLDLSLTATGIATADESFALRFNNQRGMDRLRSIRNRIIGVCSGPLGMTVRPDLVVIEGYSMGTARQSSHAHGLGELGGVVRLWLWEAGVPYVDVPPACLKKYATGAGNARKEAVLIAAVKRGAEVRDNNEADAWWLRAMGMDALGCPVVVVPQLHRKVLETVPWPLAPPARTG